MEITFPNQKVIVTGAAHGFGRAITLAFVERGAEVWACDILADELQETATLAKPLIGHCHSRTVDVTNKEAVFGFVAEAVGEDRPVTILVNNAGGVLGQVGRPLEEVSTEAWDGLFAVNTRAAFYFAQAVAPGMKQANFGRIINISSGAGLGISLTGIQGYAAAKAAQIGLTRQLAHELGPWNITVNNIAPGFVRSNPATERQWQAYGSDGQAQIVENIALKRLGTPADIAHGVLFFASEYAGWISGQILSIDGGK